MGRMDGKELHGVMKLGGKYDLESSIRVFCTQGMGGKQPWEHLQSNSIILLRVYFSGV